MGRSHECDYPSDVERLPICTRPRIKLGGSSKEIDREIKVIIKQALSVYEVIQDVLKDLQPDAIVTQDQCEVCAVSLPDVKAAVSDWVGQDTNIVSLEAASFAAVYDDVRRVAEALNAPDGGAEVVEKMQEAASEITRRSAMLDNRRSVACIEWAEPLMAAGNWIPELVEFAGGRDLFGSAGQHSPWLDWDDLRDADPDVIVLMPCGYDLERTRDEALLLSKHPHWRSLRAVRAGQTYITDGNAYFNRPGPRLKDSLEMMAEMLHPNHFQFGHEGSGWMRLAEPALT